MEIQNNSNMSRVEKASSSKEAKSSYEEAAAEDNSEGVHVISKGVCNPSTSIRSLSRSAADVVDTSKEEGKPAHQVKEGAKREGAGGTPVPPRLSQKQ